MLNKIGFLFCISLFVSAQDVIILKNGDVIKSKVTEAAVDQVRYLRYGDSTKKQYAIKNADLRGVKYNAASYYTAESNNIVANDKIFLSNGDTLKVVIQDIWGDMIRYKSSSISNGVIYAMIKSEVLGYEQNGSKTEVVKTPEKSATSSPYTSSTQTQQTTNSQAVSSNMAYSYSNKPEESKSKTSWFVAAKLGGFIPIGDFASDGTSFNSTPPDTANFPLYEGKDGYAKPGFSGGIEGAFFVNKYLGFGTEFSYSVLANKIFSGAGTIPAQFTIETKPWKLFIISPGIYGRIPLDGIYFDFKFCLAAVGGVTEGYSITDSFNYLAVNPERFSALGLVFGSDVKIELTKNVVGTFGFDYIGTFEQKIVRLVDQYDYDANELFENFPLYRDITIQGFRMNFGLGLTF